MDKIILERKSAERFVTFYSGNFDKEALVKIDECNESRPDFYYSKSNTLIEVSVIVDQNEVKKDARWGRIINKIQQEVDHNENLSKIDGFYIVETPEEIFTPTEKIFFKRAANDIILSVIQGRKSITLAGQELRVIKINSDSNGIVFGTFGSGRSFDPSVTIFDNIHKKIKKANVQLGYKFTNDIKKKVLLLVNNYYLMTHDWELFKAMGYLYEDLLRDENIDQVWLQYEMKDDKYVHKILYDRDFFIDFESGRKMKINKETSWLFSQWFTVLADKGNDKKELLFNALRFFLRDKLPHELFLDNNSRSEMARLSEWLYDQKRHKDLIWLVNKFINDPTPPEPSSRGITDEDLYYHNQIIKGDNGTYAISGVLAHLAWGIQKMSLNEDLIIDAYKCTKMLLEHENLYVKLQAIIPLIEITKRRKWIIDYDKANRTDYFSDFKKTTFDLLENYSKYSAISKSLVYLFNNYRDLGTKEAMMVLDKLSNSSESGILFIIFGIFRKDYDINDKYDGSKVERVLLNVISDNNEKYNPRLRSDIAWCLWKILDSEPDKFDRLEKYIEMFCEQEYSKDVFSSIERIIEDWLERKTEICLNWFDKYLKRLAEYVSENIENGRGAWVSPEKMVSKMAEVHPNKLVGTMKKLCEIWESGAYIGNISDLFESYKKIDNKSERERIKNEFIKVYSSMKKMNPRLQDVHFV